MPSNAFAGLSLQQLKNAVSIREKIESLERELGRIIASTGTPGVTKAPRRKRKVSAAARAKMSARMKARWAKRKGNGRVSKKPSPRGQLKDRIVGALKAAGKSGIMIKDLASKLGTSYGNVSVWFHTTGKGIKEIKKVAPGKFAWGS